MQTNENLDILEQILTEMKIKYHFSNKKRIIKISLEDLCTLLLKYNRLIKMEMMEDERKLNL